MNLFKINEYLSIGKNDDKLNLIEKLIKSRLNEENDDIQTQELKVLLLLTMLRKNNYESLQSDLVFGDILKLTKRIEKKLKKQYNSNRSKKNKMYLDVFYKTNIRRLFIIKGLYDKFNQHHKSDKINVLKKDLERANAAFEGNISEYASLFFMKIFTNYNTSYRYLLVSVFIITTIFAVCFYLQDLSGPLLVAKDFDVVQSFWFYWYVSFSTLTNLGGDLLMAGNTWLMFLFSLNQLLGVILFGILVSLFAKKMY